MRRIWLVLALSALAVGCAGPPRAPATLRVMTYNIHHGEGTDGRFDLARLATVIRGVTPDLVALQEVDVGTRRSSGMDQAAELARLTGMEHRFGEAMPYQGGQYGEAVLSRSAILEARVDALPVAAGREPRALLTVRVRHAGEDLWFSATHLDHTRDPALREQQAAWIARSLGDDRLPRILAGDLNATPDSDAMLAFHPDWVDAGASAGQPTYPATEPRRRIDYVLVRPASRWRIRSAEVLEDRLASDHRPLLVELELRPR